VGSGEEEEEEEEILFCHNNSKYNINSAFSVRNVGQKQWTSIRST